MSAPTNISPATAQAISALPFTVTLSAADLQLAPPIPYAQFCFRARHTVWYRYTPPVGITAIGIVVSDVSGNAGMSVWTGPAATPTQITDACGFVGGAIQLAVAPGETYYIALDAAQDPVTDPVSLQVVAGTSNPAPIGSFLITNDTPGFPATIISAVDGAVIWTLGLPASEMADAVPSGPTCLLAEPSDDSTLASSVNIYDANFNLLVANAAMLVPNQSSISPVRSNGSNTFYVLCRDNSGLNAGILKTISAAGVVGGTTWTLPVDSALSEGMAVSLSGVVCYYTEHLAGECVVHAYDLNANAPLADFADLGAGTTPGRDVIVLSTGDVLVVYRDVSQHDNIARFNAAGVLQRTYDTGVGVASTARINTALDSPTSFWSMSFPSTGVSRFTRWKTSDGSVLATFDVFNWEPSRTNHGNTFGPSQSCPLVVLSQPTVPCATVVITSQPANQTVSVGQSVRVCIDVQNPVGVPFCQISGPALPYGILDGCGTNQVCVTFPSVTATFTFQFVFTTDCGTTTSPPITITVVPPGVSGIGVDCTTKNVTITGSGFSLGQTIQVFDPRGNLVSFRLVSLTSTQIVVNIDYAGPGQYCVVVS